MKPLFTIEHIVKTRGKEKLLDITNFDIPENTCMVLSGRNGAGKTTLLKILAGLEAPDKVTLKYQGKTLSWKSARPLLLRHVVYLHQHAYMFDLSVADNVAYGLRFSKTSKSQIAEQVENALTWAGLSHLATRNAQSLSGGEKQRVALTRARILAPKLLLLDEPVANMDIESRQHTLTLIKRLKSEGISSIITSHEPHFAQKLSQYHRHLCKTGPRRYTIVEPFLYKGPVIAHADFSTISTRNNKAIKYDGKNNIMNKSAVFPKEKITAVILAGGRARRMGGQDKGLLTLHGKPMIEYVINAIKPQVNSLLINANRTKEQYQSYGYPVIKDILGDYYGPLVGMASGLQKAESEYVVTIPCDSPLIPDDLVQKLYEKLQSDQADLSVAHDGQRMQPVFAIFRRKLLPAMLDYLEAGGRKIDTWYAQQNTTIADFSNTGQAFMNINTPEDQVAVEDYLSKKNHD